jgi:glycosyltransferase involved in cell wall biosynthesis
MKRVSWLIPVRDDPRLIDALRSIAPELGPDDEVIVVDDGSAVPVDPEIGAEIGASHGIPAVTVLRQGRDGIVAALNRGIERAGGAYIARMDADDLVLPGRIAAQLAAFTDQDVAIAGRVRTDAPQMQEYVAWVNHNDPMAERLIESPLIHPASLLRASAVHAIGGYRRGDFPEDYDLFLRLADLGRLARVPQEVLFWRDGPARLTRTDARYASPAAVSLKQQWLEPRIRGKRVAWIGEAAIGEAGTSEVWTSWLEPRCARAEVPDAEIVLVAASDRDAARARVRAQRPDLVEGHDFWMLA